MALVLYHPVYALLECVLCDKSVYKGVLVLTDAIDTVGGLRLHGRIPPEIIVDEVTGSSKVETRSHSLQ